MNTNQEEKVMKENTRKRYIYDLVLIVSLLAVFLCLFFFFYREKTAIVAEVYIGEEVVATYSLSEDGEYPIGDGSNVLKIEDGKAYMLYADCPDGWCKHQGKVSLSGERITCLPNRVMIIVKEGKR